MSAPTGSRRRTPSSSSPSRWRPSSRASTASSMSIRRPPTTARWSPRASWSAPAPDAAILRVHEKIRANLDRIPFGIPEPLIVGRGIDDVAIVVVTLTPTPAAAERWTRQRPDAARPRAAGRARQAPRYRPELHRRRAAGGNPGRARPRAALALRHHAAAARRQDRRRQPLVRGRADPRGRPAARPGRRPDAADAPAKSAICC